ncbi:MAG: hypothetical protein Phyf2KO_19510 [Phycisphaerales bacterium]
MLHAAVIFALAGSALGAEPVFEPVAMGGQVHATSATPVLVGPTGKVLEFGETIQLGTHASRGPAVCDENVPYFDSFGVADTDGDGVYLDPVCGDACGLLSPSSRYFFGTGMPHQGYAVDINTIAQAGRQLESVAITGDIFRCDDPLTDTLQILVTLYDDIDTSGVGYDSDGDTINDTPFPPDDLDNDGVPDAFLGGVLLTYSPIPDINGYLFFIAGGLDSLSIDLPSDGAGGIRVQFVSEFVDLNGDTVPETPLPFERASPALWGPTVSVPGCPYPGPPNTSSGTWWALGYDMCTNEPDISPDPYTYVFQDFVGVVPCPETLMPAFTLFGTCPTGRLCADQNTDGLVLPNDFTAWIANFNANDLRADVNQDGVLTPTDFTAWIAAFNQGQSGPICSP